MTVQVLSLWQYRCHCDSTSVTDSTDIVTVTVQVLSHSHPWGEVGPRGVPCPCPGWNRGLGLQPPRVRGSSRECSGYLGLWGSFLVPCLEQSAPSCCPPSASQAGSVPLVLLMAVFNHQTFPLCGCIVRNEDRVISASCLAPHCRLA